MVKVDNAPAARPQTGIGAADVVYVEPVEGGLTRFAAVFWTAVPPVVGPVRSARETDLELLAPYGKPVLAFSGSAPELLPLLDQTSLVRVTPQDVGAAYFGQGGRLAPHNLYVRTDQLPGAAAGGPVRVVPAGPGPPGGRPVTTWSVGYTGASYLVVWSAQAGGWAIMADGSPLRTTDTGPVYAHSVLVQWVPMRAGRLVEDASGHPSPVASTVGSGTAVVLRDGHAYEVTWQRPTAADPTSLISADGTPVPVAPGRTWVFLVPA